MDTSLYRQILWLSFLHSSRDSYSCTLLWGSMCHPLYHQDFSPTQSWLPSCLLPHSSSSIFSMSKISQMGIILFQSLGYHSPCWRYQLCTLMASHPAHSEYPVTTVISFGTPKTLLLRPSTLNAYIAFSCSCLISSKVYLILFPSLPVRICVFQLVPVHVPYSSCIAYF